MLKPDLGSKPSILLSGQVLIAIFAGAYVADVVSHGAWVSAVSACLLFTCAAIVFKAFCCFCLVAMWKHRLAPASAEGHFNLNCKRYWHLGPFSLKFLMGCEVFASW